MAITTTPEATYYKPGTIGIGVGRLVPGIAERGEDELVFESIVWFPEAEAEAAREYADEYELHVREGVAL